MSKFNKVCIFCFAVIVTIMTCMIVYGANQISVNELLNSSGNRINVKDMGAVGDGTTDDTKVIQEALDTARKTKKTVYFPEGTYLITESLILKYSIVSQVLLQGESAEKTKLVGSESLSDDIINSSMYVGFYMQDIGMEHRGKGNCVEAWFLNAVRCSFTSVDSNDDDLVVFTGSNCRITECTFEGNNTKAYAIRHTKCPDRYESPGIAINSYITDNLFKGSSKGILVDSEKNNERAEGLKINGNIFTNSGSAQIKIETILHCDISNNTMSGSSGSAIVINPQGLLVDGLYICSNDIQATVAGVYEEVQSKPSTRVHLSNNVFHDSEYGIYTQSRIGAMIIDNNHMRDIKSAGISVSQTDELIVTDNQIYVEEGGDTISVTSSDAKTVITGNLMNKKMNNNLTGGKSVVKSNTVK